jgi:hypothetical protein
LWKEERDGGREENRQTHGEDKLQEEVGMDAGI